MMLNLSDEQECWTTTPTVRQDNEVVNLDTVHEYEFSDSNKAFANAIFARVNSGNHLYPDYPVLDLASEDPDKAKAAQNDVVVLDEDDSELRAAIAASLADLKQEAEASLAELESSQRMSSRVDSQMEVSENSDDELAASQMMDEDVFALRELLHGSCSLDQLKDGLTLFENSSASAAGQLCQDLDLPGLQLDNAITFTKALIGTLDDITHASCCCILRNLWQDKLLDLSKNASRSLVSCLSDVIKTFPAAAVETVFLPLWTSAEFRNAHCDLLNRLVKNSNPEFRTSLTSEIFRTNLQEQLSETHVNVLQTLFSSKIKASSQNLQSLLTTLEKSSGTMATNNKLSKLLLSIMETQDAQVLAACRETLTKCVQRQQTILKTSLGTALAKI